MPSEIEATISKAIDAYRNKEYTSIRACAYAFSIPKSTLKDRLSGRTSRYNSHEKEQNLSPAEEKTLLKWIKRSSSLGVPITLTFTRELAKELRASRILLSSNSTSTSVLPPLSSWWINKFRKRHPEILSVFSRSIDTLRLEAFDYATVESFLDPLTTHLD